MPLIEDNGFSPHLYADDTQVYGSCQPVEIDAFSAILSECFSVVSNWMRSNRLPLNSNKTSGVQQVGGSINFQPLHCWSTASRSLRLYSSGTWSSSSILITFNEQYWDALLRSVNCVRSATRCRRPSSNHWWSLWCYPDLTAETTCWSVFRYT